MSGTNNALLDAIAHPTGLAPNLLSAYGAGQDIAAKQWQNRESIAKQLAGQAQQGAVDPATGQYSPDKFRQNLVGAGPGAALAAQSSLGANQSLSSDQLNQARDKAAAVNSAAGAVLKSGDFSDGSMYQALHQLVSGNILTPTEAIQQFSAMPKDPAGRKAWLEQHHDTSASYQQHLDQTYGTRQPIQTGAGTTFPVVPPASAGGQGPFVPSQLSPADLATQVPGPPGPDGTPTTETLAARLARQGAQIPGAPGAASPFQNGGRLPPALRNPGAAPAAPGASPPPAGAPVGGAPVVTGQSPAAAAAQTAAGSASAAAFQGYSDAGVQARSQNAVLSNMLGDAQQFTTGPLTERWKTFKKYANQITGGVNQDKLAAAESFDKWSAQLANAQGAGSDARLNVNVSANPNISMSPGGVDQVIRQLQGNNDYLQARGKLAAAHPNQADRAGFDSGTAANLDPRAFQYARMTTDQRKTYFGTIQDKAAFKKAYLWAEQQGLVGGQ